MTYTATQLRIDHVEVRTGQYVRFCALGRLLEVCDRLYHGLGTIYQKQADGSFRRVSF